MPHQTPKQKSHGSPISATQNPLGHLFGQSTKKSGLNADWNEIEPSVLHTIIWAVNEFGGAVTFSTTRNNQAYVIKVYMGQAFDPVYYDGDADGREQMRVWAEALMLEAANRA